MSARRYLDPLDRYGKVGVEALRRATPVDSGLTANSWGYRIVKMGAGSRIEWYNTNVNDRTVIAVLIQYGHGTGTGGYVEGRDYVNPAMRRVFDQLAEEVWKEVTNA